MNTVEASKRVAIKDILFLTDFSDSSESALPFALAIARGYGAKIHALHVLMPEPMTYTTPEGMAVALDAQDEFARIEKQRVDAELAGVPHDVSVVRGFSVWDTVSDAIKNCGADLIVLGTHGRTGARKLLLGSIAEEVFRRAPVPVLTIGPFAREGAHNAGRFHCVLFATDFAPHSQEAVPYALSLAQENQARLILFHSIQSWRPERAESAVTDVDTASEKLARIVPSEAQAWCRPEVVLGYGDAAERILQTARDYHADLIVLGIHERDGHIGAATHLGRAVAHRVVAHANCPVLTVRGKGAVPEEN